MSDWLAELKEGDAVVECRLGLSQTTRSLARIKSSTPTRVIVGNGTKYRRKDGVRMGERDPWSQLWIAEATPEAVAKITEETERRSLVARIEKTQWKALSTEQLREVVQTLTAPTPEQQSVE